ncbi:MAG: serine/threonine protein kinase, partial [Burkholderiales bacterium]|nr:serine/threonine protein kinase [Burkholderiales bacterium]
MPELTKLGKYEIRKELGRGAMGVVYEAYDPLIERKVALKTIRPDALVGATANEILARFRREAQAAGKLQHPNIVAIFDFGDDQGVWYIAMELVPGKELKSYFESQQRFPTPEIVRIVSQILAALGHAHQQGIVHRDVKPANVFIMQDGTAKVADFGIAHVESSELTQVGTVLGTPAYMSPEQILGLPIDGRSDLFSVGVILYQFLTGERPFVGNATITMRKVLEEEPLPPSRFNTQIPGEMDAVVRKALAKKADERFQSAEEFTQALVKAAAGASVAAVHSGDTTMVPPPSMKTGTAKAAARLAPAPVMGPASPPAAPAQRKSQTLPLAFVGAVVLAAVAAGSWYLLQGRDKPADPVIAKATTAPPAGT